MTSTDFKTDCQSCHLPAQATDWIYVQGHRALKRWSLTQRHHLHHRRSASAACVGFSVVHRQSQSKRDGGDLSFASIVTVAVWPDTRLMPGGSGSSAIRTGIRCARRTQEKVGFTFASRFSPALVSVSTIPPAMLSTWPDNKVFPPKRRIVALSPL